MENRCLLARRCNVVFNISVQNFVENDGKIHRKLHEFTNPDLNAPNEVRKRDMLV